MDDLWLFLFEVILFPSSKDKKINPFFRLISLLAVLLLFIPTIGGALWVGFHIIGEDFKNGLLLIGIGFGVLAYLYYEYRKVKKEIKNKNRSEYDKKRE